MWQSFVVLGITLLVAVFYAFEPQAPANKYMTQLSSIILVCILLWRVETLSDLSISQPMEQAYRPSRLNLSPLDPSLDLDDIEDYDIPQTIHDKIGSLLQLYCIDTRLYLQHDLTICQLAITIGTNRYYLSQYFSRQGTTYNAYINRLRIHHFMSLYQKAVTEQRPFTARQLAFDSGYHSYSTFSAVFKQQKGQTVTAWMRDTAK